MVDIFIIRGRYSDYDIDALVCEKNDDYVWIMKDDIYDLVLSNRCLNISSPYIACMTIGPKKRNLDENSKNVRERYIVCVRCNFIRDNIINFKNNS